MTNSEIIFRDAAAVNAAVDLSSLDGATIFITGATGQVGTNILASLAHANLPSVTVVAEYHSNPAPYTWEICKKADFHLTKSLAECGNADVIIHSAGYASPSAFVQKPWETIRINTAYTQELLGRLSFGGKFLFMSSSALYGGLKGKASEGDIGTTTPQHFRGCYIEGKRCGEAICHAYRCAGVNAISARITLAYGPGTRLHDSRLMCGFIEQALTTGEIKMKFYGQELRTYCYIRDTVIMSWKVLLGGSQGVYNIAGNTEITARELASRIAVLTGATISCPSVGVEMPGSPEQVVVGMEKYTDQFGSHPYVGIDEGLFNTVEWHRNLLTQDSENEQK